VIHRRVAVCDGYARLFKTLCDYAGIRSEIIYGYARTNYGRIGKRFFSNHTWNAVYLNGAWNLLDATWASGYVTFGDSFVKHFNEAYYLTPPQRFIDDHYPEFIYWSLLTSPPTLREFQFSPFKNQAYIKFKIQSFKPATGILEANIGDTLEFEIETTEDVKQFFVSANPYFELGILPQISTLHYDAAPFERNGNKVRYKFIHTSSQAKQLHVVFNDRVILQYKVQQKNIWANVK
ncbi:MAG TPA: transglutaminase domain-containing protein, partial [Flavisolibacter sp.]|nr:transglutaminase domain-containing protein [Flavisolibacter sp.]